MSEDWCGVTQEKFEARVRFLTDFFPKWKKTYCREMGLQHPGFSSAEDKIVWRKDKDGTEYNPHHFCTLYFNRYRVGARYLMKDPGKFLDRHKIVALTQQLILENWPLTYSFLEPFSQRYPPPVAVRALNVSFAYRFVLDFLGSWNTELHKTILTVPFNQDQLFQCRDSTDFAREHYKYLMLDLTGPYQVFLVSNLWFAIEQWGLTSLQAAV